MARVGIAVTKSVSFRDATQEFSNVYYYEVVPGSPSEAQATAWIDEVVAREKTFHASNVTFVKGRCWLQTGDKATTQMITQKNLSGTGALTPDTFYPRERTFLFRLRAGVDSRGNPVYLRKWFHAMASMTSSSIPANVQADITGFTQTERDQAVARMNNIGSIGSGTTLGTLCAKSGRQPTAGENWSAHKYLEHHQLGDMWRV